MTTTKIATGREAFAEIAKELADRKGTLLTASEQREMILRGIEAKIDETLENANHHRAMGNLRQWANYLSVAARWADKLVEANIEINKEKAGF
jgi:gamma-glutamyl-gamma-aminobutyrate hydrolase PuuD